MKLPRRQLYGVLDAAPEVLCSDHVEFAGAPHGLEIADVADLYRQVAARILTFSSHSELPTSPSPTLCPIGFEF
ncbi:MAG: hypothetical protein ABR548_12920 [Actinomycetota bacterium]|nr:hypothetical protein [Actinomycetota bacterium]